MGRPLVAAVLWALALAFAAIFAAEWDDPCGRGSLLPVAAIGAGVLSAGATVASLRHRRVGAMIGAFVVAACVGGGLFLLGLIHWVENCTA